MLNIVCGDGMRLWWLWVKEVNYGGLCVGFVVGVVWVVIDVGIGLVLCGVLVLFDGMVCEMLIFIFVV